MQEIRLPSFNDFSPRIIKEDIAACLNVIEKHHGNRKKIIKEWADIYFDGLENNRSSTNIPSTLTSTGLAEGKKTIQLTEVGNSILKARTPKEAAIIFCKHLYQNKNAHLLIEAVKQLKGENKKITKETLKKELSKLGISKLSSGTTDHTTLLNWFKYCGIINSDLSLNKSIIKSALGVTSDEIDLIQGLDPGQKQFIYCFTSVRLRG
jgi:hypothetical protein